MTRLLLIETSTSALSVALAEDGIITASRSNNERNQAAMTAPYIQEVLGSLKVSDLDAICVSKGPGSYTGLRVGVSTAKGLCFGAGIPLISVGTLDTLVYQAIEGQCLPAGCRHIVPMIDARRMEVYTATFDVNANQTVPTAPVIVENNTFDHLLSEGPVLFIGDAADKCRPVIQHSDAHFLQTSPSATAMLTPALAALRDNRFEDLAYFEPFYLKEFIATISKKNLF